MRIKSRNKHQKCTIPIPFPRRVVPWQPLLLPSDLYARAPSNMPHVDGLATQVNTFFSKKLEMRYAFATSGHVSFQLNSEIFVLPFHVILVRMVKSYKSHCKAVIFVKEADRRKQTNN